MILAGIGLAMLYSASYGSGINYCLRQSMWLGWGLLFFIPFIFINYKLLSKFTYLLYSLNILFLLLLYYFSRDAAGAHRWFRIGGLSIQPSEIMKVIFILTLARYLSEKKEEIKKGGKHLIIPFLITIIPMVIIIRQPDLGTAVILLPILFCMLYVAGIEKRYLILLALMVFFLLPAGWFILKEYQKMRILVFINPDIDPLGSGYSIIQSKIAIGSGGLFGKGWLTGSQTQLRFLPANRTDFIFATLCEEWGFLGAVTFLGLWALLLSRAVKIAEQAKSTLGTLLATGLAVMLFLHIFVNIGMAMGIVPVVGLPLPLVSYGGSFLSTTIISIALLENIRMRRFMFQ